jgi:hypothetical protein
MLPYIVWRPLYLSGIDFYRWLRVSTRFERSLRRWLARTDSRLHAAAGWTIRLALFRS